MRNLVSLESLQATHGFLKSPLPLPGFAVVIVNVFRSVDTQADLDSTFIDKFTPLIGHQGSVGLKRVNDHLIRIRIASDDVERFFIPLDRHCHRFAGMPEKSERRSNHSAFPDPVHDFPKNIEIHSGLVGSVRKVTVVAIDVAERTWLNHQEAQEKLLDILFVEMERSS